MNKGGGGGGVNSKRSFTQCLTRLIIIALSFSLNVMCL